MRKFVLLVIMASMAWFFNACEADDNSVNESWNSVVSPTNQWLMDVAFIDDVSGWAVGWNGTVLKYTDGNNWESTSITGISDDKLYGVAFSDNNHGVILGYSSDNEAFVYATRNGGTSWSKVMLPSVDFIPRAVTFGDETRGWIAGSNGVVLTTNDAGQSWSLVETPVSTTLYGVDAIGAGKVYACGSSTLIYSSDGGSSWQQLIDAQDGYGWLKDIVFTDDNNGYFVTAGGEAKIFKTSDGGNSWNQQIDINAAFLNDIHFVDESNGWAVGDEGIIYRTKNGNDWSQVSSPVSYQLNAVFFPSAKNGWAAGYNGTLMHFN